MSETTGLIKRQVVVALERGPLGVPSLSHRLQLPTTTVRMALASLAVTGEVETCKEGWQIKRSKIDRTALGFNRICASCDLTFGSHRADSEGPQCPGHEGRMDWSAGPGTMFRDSGCVGERELNTPARDRRTVTVTITHSEEEPNGWTYVQDDRSVGIFGGWSHDDPTHEDVWPDVEETGGGRCGDPTGSGKIATWERHECTGCGAILVLLKSNQLDQDGDLCW